jgi:hypothetical protein
VLSGVAEGARRATGPSFAATLLLGVEAAGELRAAAGVAAGERPAAGAARGLAG